MKTNENVGGSFAALLVFGIARDADEVRNGGTGVLAEIPETLRRELETIHPIPGHQRFFRIIAANARRKLSHLFQDLLFPSRRWFIWEPFDQPGQRISSNGAHGLIRLRLV